MQTPCVRMHSPLALMQYSRRHFSMYYLTILVLIFRYHRLFRLVSPHRLHRHHQHLHHVLLEIVVQQHHVLTHRSVVPHGDGVERVVATVVLGVKLVRVCVSHLLQAYLSHHHLGRNRFHHHKRLLNHKVARYLLHTHLLYH